MSNFKNIATLLIVFIFIGFFGEPFGLKTNVGSEILDVTKPEKPSVLNAIFGMLDFIFSLALLPFTVFISDQPSIIIIIIEGLTLLLIIAIAEYLRGNN